MSERHRQGKPGGRGKGSAQGRRNRQKSRHEAQSKHSSKARGHGEAGSHGRPSGKPARGPAAKPASQPYSRSRKRPDRQAPERGFSPKSEGSRQPPVAPAATGVQTVTVTADEGGMRIDRFLEAKFPGLSFSHIQRIIRKGELRVNGKRREPKDRLEAGQAVRIPPLRLEAPPRPGSPKDEETKAFLKSITLYEDDDVMVLNKPMGLAVQGGSGTTRHIDGMLAVLTARDGQRPRLVHRLDKDLSLIHI